MNIPQQTTIKLPTRPGVPSTRIFIKYYQKKEAAVRNTIILLPGGPGNDMSMYDDPNQSISQTFFQVADVILFDPRSCGQSEACSLQACTLNHYIDDVEAIRQHFNISSNHFFVFGQSYGSIVALGYAIRYPNSLKKLLMIGGVVSACFYDEAKAALAKIGSKEQIAFAEKLWTGTFDGSPQEIAEFYRLMSPLYSYSFKPTQPQLEINYNLALMNYGWGHFLKQFDFQPQLTEVTCETLILWGENEWIMPRSHVEYIAKTIDNGSLKTYPQCSHMLWLDQWQRFTEDALNFFLNN